MISNVIVLFGWGVTVALVINLLGGTFDERTCQSVCVNMMYWGALVLAVVGLVFGIKNCCKTGAGIINVIFVLLALALLAILVGIMVIGMLTT